MPLFQPRVSPDGDEAILVEECGTLANFSRHPDFFTKWNPLPNDPLTNYQSKTVVEFRGFSPRLVE